jgi:8-oxo-dGTP pyrophosphatase MutT (NUDIX family)
VSTASAACEDAPVGEEPRRAASVIAARDAAAGLEVLVLERAGTSRFLPEYVAFPGGSTEPGDADLAERWFGDRAEEARACAVRELLEEVGLAMTTDGLVEAGERTLDSLADEPPRPEQLPEIAHWVAPPEVPVRFDARYYALEAPAGLALAPDGVETADAWWAAPTALLEDWRAERRKLYWPTYFTMRTIAPCSTVAELLALRIRTREPGPADLEGVPRSTFWQE